MCLSGPPSAPGTPISTANETAVTLEWSPPRDNGGRGDVTYSVHCRRCSSESGAERCAPCGGSARFSPRQFGLSLPRVLVTELLPRTTYSFSVEALNGVSHLSPSPRTLATVNVTTSQTGTSASSTNTHPHTQETQTGKLTYTLFVHTYRHTVHRLSRETYNTNTT